jgi:hypothetical protein
MDHILDMMEKKGWPMLLSVYLEIASAAKSEA